MFQTEIQVNRAALDDIIKPTLRFKTTNVQEFIVEVDPIKISVIISKTFF